MSSPRQKSSARLEQMNTFKLEIITPYKAYPPRDVVSISVPAEKGTLTVLAHHQSMVCCLRSGQTRIANADLGEETWTIGQGTLTVRHDVATLLVQEAKNLQQ